MALSIGPGISIGGGIAVAQPTSVISILAQPSNQSTYATGTATFSVTATASYSATLSYQWQIQQSGVGAWSNILNATSSSYTTGTLSVASDNGDNYRVIVSATKFATPVTSSVASLTVTNAVITIDTQPTPQSVNSGATATFTVSASATQSATLSYQWQFYVLGLPWTNADGPTATTASYTTPVLTVNDNGFQYRVIVSANRGASSVTSDAVNLEVVLGITNTMTVANDGYYYGADNGSHVGSLGNISSEYFTGIYAYVVGGGQPSTTSAFLQDGTYSGFTVTYGAIDSDQQTYPRVFSINNTNYTFIYDNTSGQSKYIYNGDAGLTSLVGQTVPILFDGASPSLTPNSIIVSVFEGYGSVYYGASSGYSPSGTPNQVVFGTIVSDYLRQYFYDMTTTRIILKNGTYSGAGGFTVTSGWIGSDTTGSLRVFTIGGVNYSFTAGGSGSNKQYTYVGNAGNLIANAGSTVTFVYDPDAQGGGPNMVNGTITVGNNGVVWGWTSGLFGSGNLIPAMVNKIIGSSSGTEVWFVNGTYYGGIVVDDTTATVDGQTEVTITIDGVTEIGTLETTGSTGPKASFAGDIFSLQSKNGQTLTVEMDSGGGGGGTTYSVNTDYASGISGPAGIEFIQAGPSTLYVQISQGYWSNPAGFTALYALTTGGTFVVTMPLTSATTFTITLASAWSGSPTAPHATVTSSAPLNLGSGVPPDDVPTTISSIGGGGGGGTVVPVYNSIGYWIMTDLMFYVATTETAAITALAAMAANATVTITDNTSSPTTVNLTLVGSLTKSGPTGPGGTLWQYSGTVTSSNPDMGPSTPYQQISSVTLPGGGGGSGVISGTITNTYSAFGPGYYGGGGPGGPSTISVTPAAVDGIIYSAGSNSSVIVFMPNGTYGSVVLSSSGVNGSTSITVTVGGVSVPLTVSDSGGGLIGSASGDVWNLVSRVGQSLSVSISV